VPEVRLRRREMVEEFNPVHADGIYCTACGRHSFPDGS